MATIHCTNEPLRYLFIKRFVLAAENYCKNKIKNEDPGAIIELTAASSRAIPLVGPIVEKAFIRVAKAIQHNYHQKSQIKVELTVDEKVNGKFSDEDKFRLVLIEAAVEVYCGFEYQLSNVYFESKSESGSKAAIKILAAVAGEQCMKELIWTKSTKNMQQSLVDNRIHTKVVPHHRNLLYQIDDKNGYPIIKEKTNPYNFFKMFIPTWPADSQIEPIINFLTVQNSLIDIRIRTNHLVVIDVKGKKRGKYSQEFFEFDLLRPAFNFEVSGIKPKNLQTVELLSFNSRRKAEEFVWQDSSFLIDEIYGKLCSDKPSNIEKATLAGILEANAKIDNVKEIVEKVLIHDKERYPGNKGAVLIINNVFDKQINQNFEYNNSQDDYPNYRKGAEKDSERLLRFFKDVLQNNVTSLQNVKSTELDEVLKKFKSSCLENDSDYSVVIIMSHGAPHPHTFLMDDLIPIDFYEQLFNKFNHYNFSSFISKPKLFFLDFCNGSEYCGIQDDCDSSLNLIEAEIKLLECERVPHAVIEDYFIGQSSFPRSWTYINPKRGSFYPQALVKEFEKCWKVKDLKTMHETVCQEVTLLTDQLRQRRQSRDMDSPSGVQQPRGSNGLHLPFYFSLSE